MTRHCKIIVAILLAVTGFIPVMGQVTIGSDMEPDSNAILEFKQNEDGTSEKGLLLPRVNLRSTTDPFPLSAPVKGMLVYNKTDDSVIKPGVFYNDGTQWKRIDILPGGKASQVLTLDSNMQPVWGELDVPNVTEIGYVMRKFAVSSVQTGHQFTTNAGYAITAQDHQYNTLPNTWYKLNIGTFSVTPTHVNNRLIITMQTMVQTNSDGTVRRRGWVDIAAGVFINDQLKNVKLGQFTHTGNRSFEIITMYMMVENLPVNQVQNVSVAVARLASSIIETIGIGVPAPGGTNLNGFMAKPFVAIQYYEDPSSSNQ